MRLKGGPWELEIMPERGGRISSLRLRGEELLEQGIGVDHPGAEGFVEGGAQGWDEMVPNVDPTESLPDHGEAWRMPWTVVEESYGSSVMRCAGRIMPWELERRISLSDRAVHVSYVYTNRGGDPHHAYWCAHPLFKFEEGMKIGVPGGDRLAWLASGTSTKVLLPSGSIDRVRLGWKSGAAIEQGWDAALTPYVGVWVCNGDLGGYHQIAIEPATASPELEAGGRLEWWLEIRDQRGL